MRRLIWLCILLAGCSTGGAVRFAPTPVPLDETPATYAHPSAAFRAQLPGDWAIYERHVQTLAAASFSPPGSHVPLLRLAALRTDAPPQDASAINTLLDRYQTTVRPDAGRYREQSREAMGDGSWRLTGLRQTPGGGTQQVNTFIEFEQDLIGVAEVVLPTDPRLQQQLQAVLNTFQLQPEPDLQPADLDTLAFATTNALEPLNVHGWTTADGVFFITGEVANYTDRALMEVPIRAVLSTADGREIAEAVDTVMGYGVPPSGFAPFSLRFGDGQPALTSRYRLFFGDEGWSPYDGELLPTGILTWTDESELTEEGRLVVRGSVSNASTDSYAYLPRVIATVFDEQQRIVAAGFTDLDEIELEPGETTPFELVLPELGGFPSRYIIEVQAQP